MTDNKITGHEIREAIVDEMTDDEKCRQAFESYYSDASVAHTWVEDEERCFQAGYQARADADRGDEITIAERDRAQQAADDLVSLIEDFLGIDCGEHTNFNCPWANADEVLTAYLNNRKDTKASPTTEGEK